ncbi:MAG TPA: AAA family ATPase [Gaiellaceae bacterium]
MRIALTLKNFRAFSDTHPARIQIGPGYTAFIGTNNAGKSSLLRFVYEFRQAFEWIGQNAPANSFGPNAPEFGIALPTEVPDPEELFNNRNARDIEIDLVVTPTPDDEWDPEDMPEPERLTIRYGGARRNAQLALVPAAPGDDLAWTPTGVLLHGGTPFLHLGLYRRALILLSQAMYIGAFRNAITVGGQRYYDLNIGREFITAWDNFKAGTNRANALAALRVTTGIKEIFGFKDLELNATNDGSNLQVVVDGNQVYMLHELGAGVAHFVVTLAFLAVNQPPIVLIDEPEASLHPSLQIDFLAALAAHGPKALVFATHSIGLARAAADRTYVVRIVEPGVSEVRPLEGFPHLVELLGELSFDGYRELGFDAVLLVEGATDVKVMREFLRKYTDERKILVMPLGGGQLVRPGVAEDLAEFSRISANVWALVDSERSAEDATLPDNVSGFLKDAEGAGFSARALARRAIENYFSDRAVKQVFGSDRRSLEPYEDFADVNPRWAKSDGWRIAREMQQGELAGTDLDEFLNAIAAAVS